MRALLVGTVLDLATRRGHYRITGNGKKEYPFESGGIIGAASPDDDPSSVGARQSLLSEEKMQELGRFITDRAAQQRLASTQ